MDYTIQKAVQLGVNTIIPLMAEFSNVSLDPERCKSRLRHWKKIIISACEQCGRNLLPEIQFPTDLDSWVKLAIGQEKLVLHPGFKQALASFKPATKNGTLICGSEGGFSDPELARCVDTGCRQVSLGPRILRTETAAITAIVICQSHWGDIC